MRGGGRVRRAEERGAEDGDGGLAVLACALEVGVAGVGEEGDEGFKGGEGGELGEDEAFVVYRDGGGGVHEGRSKHTVRTASMVWRA